MVASLTRAGAAHAPRTPRRQRLSLPTQGHTGCLHAGTGSGCHARICTHASCGARLRSRCIKLDDSRIATVACTTSPQRMRTACVRDEHRACVARELEHAADTAHGDPGCRHAGNATRIARAAAEANDSAAGRPALISGFLCCFPPPYHGMARPRVLLAAARVLGGERALRAAWMRPGRWSRPAR